MKRTRKTERRIATQRQDDIARQRRTAGRRGYTEEQLHKVLPPVTEPENRHDRKLGPLRKDADALDRAVHELELVNYERSQRGEKTLSYGQWSSSKRLEAWRENNKIKTAAPKNLDKEAKPDNAKL